MNPKYPIYIVSKGRWESRLTNKALAKMGVPHYIIVESQEAELYRAAVGESAEVLILDPMYQRFYNTCDALGDSKSKGPGPARNFAWNHAIKAGYPWHWVMDDNIRWFGYLNRNLKTPGADGTMLRCMEDFVDRFDNVAMAGPQYFMFLRRKVKVTPFQLNTRIYSCNLIRNDLPYRWRGRYNEDTDLSLRMLKDGWCTVIFQAFLQYKSPTQTVKGGNTAEFYAKEGTLPKSQMQVTLHPDVSKLVWRYNRWHHHVDYSGFTQGLHRREGVEITPEVDNYRLVFQRHVNGEWITEEPRLTDAR